MEGASTSSQPVSGTSLASSHLFSLGAELLSEVQRIIGTNKVRTLRVKLGDRVVKEIAVGPLTAFATVGIVLLAVIVSTMSIEVEHEPARDATDCEATD